MKLQVEIIDPAFAKQALDNQVTNRRLSQAKVAQYARDMKDGKWNENNGETIKFTDDGRLLDGQHRLAAIILSQSTLGMAVARNVPVEAFVTIDSGKTRNLSDVLSIEGYKNVTTLAGIARAAYNYIAGVSYSYSPTRATLEEFIIKHSHMAAIANRVGNHVRTFPKVPLATILYLGTHAGKYADEAEDFIDKLQHGTGLFTGDAVLTLREWYASNRGAKKSTITTEVALFGCARVWNAFVEGRSYPKMAFARGVNFRRDFLHVAGHDRNMFPDVPLLGEKK
jgi:hypothetical protein